MAYDIEIAETAAKRLHGEVPYGNGSTMYAQVKATAAEIFENVGSEDRSFLYCVALLHKSQEKKRIAEGLEPLSNSYIEEYFGTEGVKIIRELASEPDDLPRGEAESDRDYKLRDGAAKAEWAKGLSAGAQKILLAEKLANFMTSWQNPNPKWSNEKHALYYESRMPLVEALKDTDADTKKMYDVCVYRMQEGLKALGIPVPAKYSGKNQVAAVSAANERSR